MGALIIVMIDPGVQVGLPLIEGCVDHLSEGYLIELLFDRSVEPLADAVGLGTVGLGPRMVDIINGQVQLIIVPLRPATELGAAVGQYAQQIDPFRLQQRQYPIVEQISRRDRCFGLVQLAGRHLAVGVDKGLLINPANTLNLKFPDNFTLPDSCPSSHYAQKHFDKRILRCLPG